VNLLLVGEERLQEVECMLHVRMWNLFVPTEPRPQESLVFFVPAVRGDERWFETEEAT